MDLFRLRPPREGYLEHPARQGDIPVWITPGIDSFSACFVLCLDSLRHVGQTQFPSWPPVMNPGDSLTLVFRSADSNLRFFVKGGVARNTAKEALDAARSLWRNLLIALSSAAERLSFVPSHNPFDYVESLHSHSYHVFPQGLTLSAPSATKIGFVTEPQSAQPDGLVHISWPAGQRESALDGVATLLMNACEGAELSVSLRGYKIEQSIRSVIERCAANTWTVHSQDGRPVIDKDTIQWVDKLISSYASSPSGVFMDCALASDAELPETLLLLVGKAIYGEQPVGWRPTGNPDSSPDNDLRGLLPVGDFYPFPAPSTDFFEKLNLRISYPRVPSNLPIEGILLGMAGARGRQREVRFAEVDRSRHNYIIGATGTGKSTLLLNMIRQDIRRGDGVCLLDPHGDLYSQIIDTIPPERADDVIVIDASDFERAIGLNILETTGPHPDFEASFIANELLKIFDRLYNMREAGGPMFELYMRNALLLVMQSRIRGGTIIDVVRMFGNSTYRRSLLENCTNSMVVEFWRTVAHKAGGEASLENIAPYITSKLNQFTHNALLRPIIRQSQSTVDFRQCMDERKIVLVNLAKGLIGDKDSRFLGMIIIGKLFAAAMSRVDVPLEQRHPFYVYIDEAQNLSTDTMADILAEGRKFGLVLTLANQTLSQISGSSQGNLMQAVLGNVGTLLLFRIGPLDAGELLGFVGSGFSKQDLESMEDRHVVARLLNHGWPMPPFVFTTLPPAMDRVESSLRSSVRARIELNRQTYTSAVAVVDADNRIERNPEAESQAQATRVKD